MSELFSLRNQDKLGKLILVCCILFCFVLTYRILDGRFLSAGDSFWHYSNETHMIKSVSEGTGLFGCFQKGMGSPLCNFYQPLLYMMVTGIYFLCLKSISVFFIHNFLLSLFFSLFPLSVYYLARSFRFTHIKSGVATMFSIMAVSGWGHTLDAYFWIGLHTQLIGACMFPVAMGALHRMVWSRDQKREFWIFIVSLSALLMGHAVFAILLAYCLGLYILFFMFWRGWRTFLRLFRKTLVAGVLVFLIVSFWLVPFLEFNSKYKFVPESERSFSRLAVSVTAQEFMDVFFSGELLDNANSSSPLFGGGREGFRWSMNESFRRYFVFTIFVFIGLVFIIFRGRKFRELYFLLLFFWGGCLFLGKDDVGWLSVLPYSRSFQAVRAIFIIELAGAVIAGDVFVRVVKYFMSRKIPSFWKYSIVTIILLSCLPLIVERYRIGSIMVKTQVTKPQKELMRIISKTEPDHQSRIFFGKSSGIKDISLRSMLDCNFLNNVTGHDNAMSGNLSHLINELQEDIPYSADLMDLLNIKYILTKHNWNLHQEGSEALTKKIYSGVYFDLHKVKNRSDFFTVFKRKPVLVCCDNLTWYTLNRLWLDLFVEHGYDLALMVKAQSDFYELLGKNIFSALILIDQPIGEKSDRYRKIKEFSLKGGKVLSNRPVGDISVEKLSISNSGVFAETLLQSPFFDGRFIIKKIKASWNRYGIVADLKKTGGVLVAKMPFYHTWRTRIFGKKIEPLWVSPGFIGVVVPMGDSRKVTLVYKPSWYRGVLLLSAVLGIILFLFIPNGLLFKNDRYPRFFKLNGVVYYGYFRIVCFCVIGYFLLLCVRQSFLGEVSLIYPYDGQEKINPEEVVFLWNRLKQAEKYRFQLASDRSFSDPIFDLKNSKKSSLGYRGLKSYKNYYWRVESITKNNKVGWSKIYRFKTGNYFPVVADR